MLSQFFNYCDNIYPLSEVSKNALAECILIKELGSEEMILKAGHTANHACFVTNGLVRSYYLKNDEEITTKFLPKGSFITSIFSFYSRKPGTEFIKTVTASQLFCLHHNDLQKLYKEHLEINALGRIITEKYLFFLEVEIYNLRKQNAEERYKFFMKHYPHILKICPLKYIASYLGISTETLSRIRSKKNNF
jgi:CRP-like cAMP-binding protein